MIGFFYWNGLILNIRFYFQYFFFNSEIYFCRYFILLTNSNNTAPSIGTIAGCIQVLM